VSIETKVKMPRGEQTVPGSYAVNCKPVEFTRDAPNNRQQKIKRRSKWASTGRREINLSSAPLSGVSRGAFGQKSDGKANIRRRE